MKKDIYKFFSDGKVSSYLYFYHPNEKRIKIFLSFISQTEEFLISYELQKTEAGFLFVVSRNDRRMQKNPRPIFAGIEKEDAIEFMIKEITKKPTENDGVPVEIVGELERKLRKTLCSLEISEENAFAEKIIRLIDGRFKQKITGEEDERLRRVKKILTKENL